MKREILRRGGSALLLLALLLGLVPAAFAADTGNLYITGYTVTDAAGKTVGSVTKGTTVNLAVSIKDTGDGTGAEDPGTLDITKLDDSFTGGSVSVQRTSEPGKPLVYRVTLTGVTYKGVGQTLRLQVGKAGQPDSYQTMEVTVTEAVVYEAPTPAPDIPSTPEAAPAPMVVISRSDLDKPIEAGQEVGVTVYFRNLSNTKLKSAVATFTPTDALTIQGGTSSFVLDEIGGKKTVSVKLKLKAASTIATPAQSLGVELKFNYYNNLSTVQGSVTDKVSIPALGRESVPQPPVVVTRSPIEAPVAPGQTLDVTLTFRNGGTTKLVAPVLAVTPSESLILLSDTSTFLLRDIEPGKSQSVTVKLRAAKDLASTNQALNTELKFSYDNGGMLTQATSSDRVGIPAQGKESIPQPLVILTRSHLEKPLSAGETATITLTFQNTGTTDVTSPLVSVTPSESLMLLNDASSFLLPDIAPGKSQSVAVQVKAVGEITSSNQALNTELKYTYFNGETTAQATSSDKINLTANLTSKGADASVPNVVIRDFTYGETSVPAGSRFPLSFTFENTGRVAIENLVVTVDGGESFAMDGSTNTFFYRALAAGGQQKQEVPMRSVPASKSGAQSISVAFKYEYVDGDKRTQATAEIKISVPVFQPDRFQINAPTPPDHATVGEESEVLLTYVNKGKDDIANVEATVEGDGVETPARTQYLGNITAGTNGSIGFALTPSEAGEISLVLKVTYEDADQQIQTREFPLTFQAEEYIPADFPDDDFGVEESPSFPWVWVAAAGGGLAVLALALFLLRRKKAAKAAAAGEESWGDWNDDAGLPGGED